jgi:alpha-ketoglutarate-dependent taurine dioxygenase
MNVNYLDCTDEVSEFREPPSETMAWIAADISDADWIVQLPAPAREEIRNLAQYIVLNPVQNLQRTVHELDLPQCRIVMEKLKIILAQGVGFCVLDRLPIDDYPIEIIVEIYWLLGQLIGRPVAQKWDGQMIYDVSNTGTPHNSKIRGSHTNIELVFHTDNAFARMVPDYVGLLCRYPARSGGISRFCSLYTVHNRMHGIYPRQLERLYQPMFFNRQAEHHPDGARVSLAPFFSWNGERLNARANSFLVRAGYEVAGQAMDALLESALDAIDEVFSSEDIWFEAPLQRGQVQYLNNHEVGHYRSAFQDHDDPDLKRQLFRLWHRERGSVAYDGGKI